MATGTDELEILVARASMALGARTPPVLLSWTTRASAPPRSASPMAWRTKAASMGSMRPLSWMTSMWSLTTVASVVAALGADAGALGVDAAAMGVAAAARWPRPPAAAITPRRQRTMTTLRIRGPPEIGRA